MMIRLALYTGVDMLSAPDVKSKTEQLNKKG
jgi:hypothetical protein